MVSHYYLQRSELRTARHAPAAEFAKELAVEGSVQASAVPMEDLSLADVESAYSSMRMMENVILAKKRRGKGAS